MSAPSPPPSWPPPPPMVPPGYENRLNHFVVSQSALIATVIGGLLALCFCVILSFHTCGPMCKRIASGRVLEWGGSIDGMRKV